jgi:outer membrane protein assembly factor BamB
VKAAPAVADGKVYVGDYAGEMYALNAVNGDVIWQSSGQGGSFGQAGRFYSAPAVAYGRVYAGNVDGRVYSFDAESGELAWTHSAGNYVYSGVVAADTPGSDPAVYFGSHDQNAYALDARTGEQLWVRDLNAPISGAGAVIGELFYVSTLGGFTYGLDLKSGEEEFKFEKGEYNPAISDGVRLYITGYSSINAFEVKTKDKKKPGGGQSSSESSSSSKGKGQKPGRQP